MTKFRLPDDPNRVLGGKITPKKQGRPMNLYTQVAGSTTLRRLNKTSGVSGAGLYRRKKLKEFAEAEFKNREYIYTLGGVRFYVNKRK